MKMRPLVIDDETKTKVARLKGWADTHRYSFHELKRICEGLQPSPGDEAAIEIPVGYRVAYSIEQQPLKEQTKQNRFLWTHHLSISVSSDRMVWPHPLACEEILRLFGMDPKHCAVFPENDDNDDHPSALNFVQEEIPENGD